MKQNMGMIDRIIRVIIAVIIAVLYFIGKMPSGALGLVLSIVAIIFLLTSAVGFCPLYKLLGISTKKEK